MSKLKAILALLTGNIVKDIGEAFDKNFTSKEEKEQALIEKEKLYNERLQIISKMTDPDPDRPLWLRDNLRPMVLLIFVMTLSIIMIFNIQVDERILELYTKWTGIAVGFYFGAREVVKAVVRSKKNK